MNQTRKIFCNTCKTETNQELRAIHSRYVKGNQLQQFEYTERVNAPLLSEFGEHDVVYKYRLWICRGCDTATLQESCTHKMLLNEDDHKAFWIYTFHPKRAAEHCSMKRFLTLPAKLWIIYYEIIESFNAQLAILTAIGLRALLEGICVDKGISDKATWGLEGKLKELERRQHLPLNIVKSLRSFKFIGDDAAHRLEAASIDDLKLAIEVMEDLLSFLYSLDAKADFLFRQIKKDAVP
jgi:hypothetical protein